MTAQSHPLTFIHPECGKPALHVSRMPNPFRETPTETFRRGVFEHLDGSPVVGTDRRACDSCGGQLYLPDMTKPENYRRRQ